MIPSTQLDRNTQNDTQICVYISRKWCAHARRRLLAPSSPVSEPFAPRPPPPQARGRAEEGGVRMPLVICVRLPRRPRERSRRGRASAASASSAPCAPPPPPSPPAQKHGRGGDFEIQSGIAAGHPRPAPPRKEITEELSQLQSVKLSSRLR